jgi:hypothetical protein
MNRSNSFREAFKKYLELRIVSLNPSNPAECAQIELIHELVRVIEFVEFIELEKINKTFLTKQKPIKPKL